MKIADCRRQFIPKPLPDLALGAFEAAAILGVHWTRPARMVKDQLLGKPLRVVWSDQGTRTFLIYSLADCERNYRQYRKLRAAGDSSLRRPRAHTHLRGPALRRLARVTPILYSDAIGTGEAADILECHATLIQQLVAAGKLVARKPWSTRNTGTRFQKCLIISRKSVEERRNYLIQKEIAGTKRGGRRLTKKLLARSL